MISKTEIDRICVSLEADGTGRFYIVLDSAGSINRSGSGIMTDEKDDLYIGVTKEPIFKELISSINESLLQGIGQTFDIPFKNDIPCKLII